MLSSHSMEDGWHNAPPLRRRSDSDRKSGAVGWIAAGCAGRNPWIRLPVVLWCAWMWKGHLADPLGSDLVKGLNLGIHELGHVLWSPFGQFLTIAGGSLTQCLAPLAGTAMFVRQKDPFAVFFSFAWLGTNLFDVATYAADARSMELPLVSPFGCDEVIHDWNFLLEHTGLLARDQAIASTLRLGGSLAFIAALAGMALCLRLMLRHRTPGP